ncbi:transposable element Tcb2 transposase [Trichonephila clavipes]|nr:transposable element Tcb2 transposase [Trichonephila clavipes]
MTAQRYVHDILEAHVLSLIRRHLRAIFEQVNSRPLTAMVSQDFLPTITTLPWPARSPDLSPIESIWDHLERRVWHPTSLNELEARLQQIWNEMSQDIIQNLYASMPDLQQGSKSSVLLPFSSEIYINDPFSFIFYSFTYIKVVIPNVKFRFILTTPS